MVLLKMNLDQDLNLNPYLEMNPNLNLDLDLNTNLEPNPNLNPHLDLDLGLSRIKFLTAAVTGSLVQSGSVWTTDYNNQNYVESN